MGKRLWNTGEEYCKELTDYHKKEKNKQLKTTLLGRNIRSRKWKVCRFLNPWHFRRKSRHGLWPRTGRLPEKLPFSPLLPPALGCFLVGIMLRNHISILRIYLLWRQHSSFTCSHHTHRQKDFETLKCQPFEKERFRNNELLHGDQTVRFFFPAYMCSPLTQRPKNSATA